MDEGLQITPAMLNKTFTGPALDGPREMKEDYGPSEGGSLERGVSYAMKITDGYPGPETNSVPSGPGQMPPQHFKGSADRGTHWG